MAKDIRLNLNLPEQAKADGLFKLQNEIRNEEGQFVDNPKSEDEQIAQDVKEIVLRELKRRQRRQARDSIQLEDIDINITIN